MFKERHLIWQEDRCVLKEAPVRRSLRGGAKLLTRLKDNDISQLDSVTEYYRVKQTAILQLEVKPENRTIVFNSSLQTVNARLSVDLVNKISTIACDRKNSLDPGREIVILDWGAGTGRALAEMVHELRSRGIFNVRMVGFGHMPFKEWHDLPKGIDMILDVAWALPLYLEKGTVDIIYSHLGLKKIHKEYFKMLYSLLRDGGELVMDMNRSSGVDTSGGDCSAQSHAGFFLKKMPRKSLPIKS